MALKKNSTITQKLIRISVVLILFLTVILTGFVFLIYQGQFGPVPHKQDLMDIRNQQASSVYTADDELLGRYYLQNRHWVSLDEVAPEFIDALLAIEDIRFHQHRGLDYRAMGRVFVRSLILQQNAGGGSTLSQQLAKNLYPRSGFSWFNIAADKVREIIIARKMERIYSKDEILELYVNTVSFGEDTWGIKTAAERFFNTTPADLELHQAATLAGMLRATTFYNPRINPNNAKHRRNVVLRQMERYNMTETDEVQDAINESLDLDYNRISHHEGMAPHFRQHLRSQLQYILKTQPALDGESYNLFTDGLIIETTIDSRLQEAAEQAVSENLTSIQNRFDEHRNGTHVFDEDDPAVLRAWRNSERYQRLYERGYSDDELADALDRPIETELFQWENPETVTTTPRDSIRHYLSVLNSGFLAMEPSTGEVKAWVGGISHDAFQFDHVRARRQTGSAFKPFVYASALESGVRPCDYKRNQLTSYVSFDDWTPSNLDDEYGGRYSVQAALSKSVNTITVELLRESGIEHVQKTAERMGIQADLPSGPSLALGTAELSLLDMVRAYTSFLNRGLPAETRYINKIYNADGELIYDFSPNPINSIFTSSLTDQEAEPAFSETTASAMVHMLSKAVDEGTASSLRSEFGIQQPVAGKTGTTQNYTDGWFIGMTPDLVFGSWVGGTTPRVQLPAEFGFASQTALPVAGSFLKQMEELNGSTTAQNFNTADLPSREWDFRCEDYRDDRLTDRIRDFFTGNDPSEARMVDDDEESTSITDRVRGWFSRD